MFSMLEYLKCKSRGKNPYEKNHSINAVYAFYLGDMFRAGAIC